MVKIDDITVRSLYSCYSYARSVNENFDLAIKESVGLRLLNTL